MGSPGPSEPLDPPTLPDTGCLSHQPRPTLPHRDPELHWHGEGWSVIALNHITCPKVSPMATGLQSYNYWRFMLAVMALLSRFTFSLLEECIRCTVLTQRRFI